MKTTLLLTFVVFAFTYLSQAINPAPHKMVLIEEQTGTWCSWCPRGFVYLETSDLPSGSYILQMVTNRKSEKRLFIKE